MRNRETTQKFGALPALPARVDGVDVAQLLRKIGEASASQSSVDLIGLCLDAQRVLQSSLGGSQ
jgi:hypothetical protein